MVSIIAFDVNETLLDLRPLDAHFERLFGIAAIRPLWFSQMLQLSFVGGLTGEYVDFRTAQRAALEMVAARNGITLAAEDITAVVDQMNSLPPHPDVPGALERLQRTGIHVVALVNSLESVGEAQLQFAGIRPYFERVMSADSVRSLKPAPAPYNAVAAAYGTPASEVRLVAAHSWDISGALAAGCAAAFVARSGAVLSPLGKQPDIVGIDLQDVVSKILAIDIGN